MSAHDLREKLLNPDPRELPWAGEISDQTWLQRKASVIQAGVATGIFAALEGRPARATTRRSCRT